ncbi:MAG TPA: prenyltransferase/squalene oxidase repeat-containing protein [Thermoanaerobaculia bacterium]|nr:prenyltransferase/squalene oxidase repeat-containing protein [Thermoanaerobaculia bacterium]
MLVSRAARHEKPFSSQVVFTRFSLIVFILASAAPAGAQPVNAGAAYLAGRQAADGSWESSLVRRSLVTAEALRALQTVGQAPASRAAAAGLLENEPVEDSDDRARRIAALAAEGRSVAPLVTRLLADVDPDGGWGLVPGFAADPLDTALALAALSSQPAAGDTVLRPAFSALIAAQRAGGGWPCIESTDDDSEIFCTSEALLALVSHRSRYVLEPQIDAAAGFLRRQLNPDGSFGPAGPMQLFHTALASRALAAVPAFGSEVATVISFLNSRQRPDGSWEGDPYTTALALRALQALAQVAYCGDGKINQPGETCDGSVPTGVTCHSFFMGPGTLSCSSQCSLDASGCSVKPVCGDHRRNQPFEVCDGKDLAAQTCQSLDFASGTLACAADCRSFNVGGCRAAPKCGDGVVNQPGEICDLSDLKGATCQSLSLGNGLLQCASDCNLDTRQCNAASIVLDHKGREFFLTFLYNPNGTASPSVHLTSDIPTSVTVQYPVVNPTFSRTVPVNPGQVTSVDLTTDAIYGARPGFVMNNAVRLSGPEEFSAHIVNQSGQSTDAALMLPVDALGTFYIVSALQGSTYADQDRTEFYVVAPFNGTTLTITPTATMRLNPSPSTFGGPNYPANVPVQITLDRGQAFAGFGLFPREDLSGTLIESNRPVAVLNGNYCATVPSSTPYCNHVFEMAHPVRSWGASVFVANLPDRPGGSVYRVIASEDGTEVALDGILQATLKRGKVFETGPLAGSHIFSANHPIFVTQFMTGARSPGAVIGDPSMVNVIPPDQYLNSYTVSTVGGFQDHFLTMIAPASSLGALTLDGAPIDAGLFTPIAGSGYSSAIVPILGGTHRTSSPQPHGVTVIGVAPYDTYAYPGGARVEFINQFCGDDAANRDSEECDGNDFRGHTCASFEFATGMLRCTADCRVDLSGCAGFSIEDVDGDGFPAAGDCNDRDLEVNPGMPEFPGNGVDDDCNPATPDAIPQAAVSCRLFADRLSYSATDIIRIEGEVRNAHGTFSLTGLSAALGVRDGDDASAFAEQRQLAPLPPGARAQQSFVFSAAGKAPESYRAELTVTAGGNLLARCSAGFTIENSASNGAGLRGDLTLNPELVDSGNSSDASYTLQNQGNAPLAGLAIRVLLLDPVSGAVASELLDSASLDPGASFSATRPLSTLGLASNKRYLAVLLAKPGGTDAELTLDNALLTVVNAPPDCSAASVSSGRLWPANHKLVAVTIGGVTDPDGDPVTVSVAGVLQDERTDDLGSGDTCPDAIGVGTSRAGIRAERSGRQDGRIYHIFFTAEDNRGGRCAGEVKVCVPHDQSGRRAVCVDQGPLFDSTACQ